LAAIDYGKLKKVQKFFWEILKIMLRKEKEFPTNQENIFIMEILTIIQMVKVR